MGRRTRHRAIAACGCSRLTGRELRHHAIRRKSEVVVPLDKPPVFVENEGAQRMDDLAPFIQDRQGCPLDEGFVGLPFNPPEPPDRRIYRGRCSEGLKHLGRVSLSIDGDGHHACLALQRFLKTLKTRHDG